MRAFEFHFNPKAEHDAVFDTFCYEPEKPSEKKLGGLYMLGFLKNALPKNAKLLQNLSATVKEKYYSSKTGSPERALKSSLKQANQFLDKLSKSGDVSWLGNIGFIILSVKDSKMNFAKVGGVKPFLIRANHTTDIDEKIDIEEMDPYPVKLFTNIVSGKLAENDLVLLLTEKLFKTFEEENVLKSIADLQAFGEKELQDILREKKKSLNRASGALLVIDLSKEKKPGKKKTISDKESKEFSFKKTIAPLMKFFRQFNKKDSAKPKKTRKKIEFKIPKIKIPEIKLPSMKKAEKPQKRFELKPNQNLILMAGLSLLLVLGFAFSQFEKDRRTKLYLKDIEDVQNNLQLSESYLLLDNAEALEQANVLLEEAWEKASVLSKNTAGLSKELTEQVSLLKNEVSGRLFELNKLEEIENPELFFEFDRKEFVPHKIIIHDSNIYSFNPYNPNMLVINQLKQTEFLEIDRNFKQGTSIGEAAVFFSEPNDLTIVKSYDFKHLEVQASSPDFTFDELASFKGNLYFFSRKTGQIIKYPYLGNLAWDIPTSWLNYKDQRIIDADSFALDNSAWLLKDNGIYNYYKGEFRKELELTIFPKPKDLTKIYTFSPVPYLYIMEPIQERIIVLDKDGIVVKQFQSEQFDNLLDFTVSEDGETVYLLNGLKIFKVSL